MSFVNINKKTRLTTGLVFLFMLILLKPICMFSLYD